MVYYDDCKKYEVGQIIDHVGHSLKVIKNTGMSFRKGRKVFYQYQVEKICKCCQV